MTLNTMLMRPNTIITPYSANITGNRLRSMPIGSAPAPTVAALATLS